MDIKKLKISRVDVIKQQERKDGDDRFFEMADRLAELNEIDPITEAEIQDEIKAYRREKRGLS